MRKRLTHRFLDELGKSVAHVQASGLSVVKRGNEMSISVRPNRSGGGRTGNGYRWAILIDAEINETVFDDYVKARLWDAATDTYSDEEIIVAKPYHLMRSTLDGETIDYLDGGPDIAYEYEDDQGGQRRAAVESSPGDAWDEVVNPFWYEGELIRIAPCAAIVIEPVAEYTGLATFGGASETRIARPSGAFITDGFTVGSEIRVTGTANNDGTYVLTSVGTTKMEVGGLGGLFTLEANVDCTIEQGIVAHWQDVNREARKFVRGECLGDALVYDEDGCIDVDRAVGSTANLTVVTGVSHAIVSGTPDKLRITVTRGIVTFKKNAAGMLIDYSVAGTSSTTSDVNLDECP